MLGRGWDGGAVEVGKLKEQKKKWDAKREAIDAARCW
jgi:hypothetical protein